eukprot:101849-Amorphochlora_amoeboformis.AAC.2
MRVECHSGSVFSGAKEPAIITSSPFSPPGPTHLPLQLPERIVTADSRGFFGGPPGLVVYSLPEFS